MSDLVISVYGSHNAAVCMYYKRQYYVVEVERWTNIKNSGLVTYLPVANPQMVFDEIVEWLLSKTEGEDVDVFLTAYADSIVPKFNYKQKIIYDHHTSHAATAFYQSPYDEMLVFTFDGGGDGAFFNVYLASRSGGIKLIGKYNNDLGFPYMVLSEILDDIKRESLSIGNLVYAGKLMGLCAYGTVREEWLNYFENFYMKFYYDGVSYIGGTQIMERAMKELMSRIGVKDYQYGQSRYTGQLAWDIAATSQKAFENCFYKIAGKYIDKYPDLPIGLSGGCALNVLLNTRIALQKDGKVYVPPNTSDCGMAAGAVMWYLKPQEQVDLTYSGLPIMDEYLLSKYVNELNLSVVEDVSVKELAAHITEGNIVGLLQGRSEHGSRALGNRSIICSPSAGMKDTINFKVKKREWYRPFAPVVKLEEVNKYFDFDYESRHMTYAAPVKEQWRDIIPAVTHVDGTGRLQTVTSQQNSLLYDLITEFEKMNNFAVLLNTSFNVNGKPILSTLSDAFNLLINSDLDSVYYKDKLFFKNSDHVPFIQLRKSKGLNVIPLDPKNNKPTICLLHHGPYSENISQHIKMLNKEYGVVILVAREEVCDAIDKKNIKVKTYPITKNKMYHCDRMGLVDTDEIFKRLKLIWAREISELAFKTINNFCFIDYDNSVNFPVLLKKVKALEEKFYENKIKICQDQTINRTGFGVLILNKDNVKKLVDISESVLMDWFRDSANVPVSELPVSSLPTDRDMCKHAMGKLL